ncbi:MAG: hypothetical protein QXU98_01550 [Candidatus Parvarchaeota archaeon]
MKVDGQKFPLKLQNTSEVKGKAKIFAVIPFQQNNFSEKKYSGV